MLSFIQMLLVSDSPIQLVQVLLLFVFLNNRKMGYVITFLVLHSTKIFQHLEMSRCPKLREVDLFLGLFCDVMGVTSQMS